MITPWFTWDDPKLGEIHWDIVAKGGAPVLVMSWKPEGYGWDTPVVVTDFRFSGNTLVYFEYANHTYDTMKQDGWDKNPKHIFTVISVP